MKKIGILLLIVLLTGCGKKVVDCNKTILETDTIIVNRQIILTYNDKKLSNEKIIINYKTNGNTNEIKNTIEEQYSIYQGQNGIDYYFEDVDGGFNFVLDINVKKVDSNIKEELEITKASASGAMVDYKNNGYECIKK